MKKKITGIMLAALLCSGSAAMAADATYNDSNNSVSVDASGYHAVIITNDDTKEIVYVDQSDDESFSAAASFLIKAGADEGTYTVLLGGKDGSTKPDSYMFSITKAAEPAMEDATADRIFEETNSDNTKNVAFGWNDAIDGSLIKSIVITLGGKSYGHDLGTYFTQGSNVIVGIKINGITVDTTGASAYLSGKTIDKIKQSKGN